MIYEGQLSKWWKTPSAQAAMKRAAESRTARLNQVKAEARARKLAAEKEFTDWNEKEAR